MPEVSSPKGTVAIGDGMPTPTPPPSRVQSLLAMRQQSSFWILIVLAVLVVFFAVTSPSGTFVSVFNLQSVLASASPILILGTAATFVIVLAGIDLSSGSLMTLGAVVSYLVMDAVGLDQGWTSVLVGAAAGIGIAAAWGLLNGLLIAKLRVAAFVVTLGSLGAALGVSRLLAGGAFASSGPPELQQNLGIGKLLGIPVPFVIAAVVVIVFGLLLAYTRFGERVYLVGANEEAARRAGISVTRVQVKVYLLAGALAGVAGVLDFARFDSVDISTGHMQALIAAIAAVIIGGASLTGGVGTVAGTAIAAFIPVVLNNGLVILGIASFWQDVAVGVILVAAVAFDQWRRGRELRPQRAGRTRSG